LHERGLDNAGKTTIVKKIMNEDVNSVSPTLGFIIKTIEYDGYVYLLVHTEEMLTKEGTN
jgi:ADP-ribosylation factor-like protein 2